MPTNTCIQVERVDTSHLPAPAQINAHPLTVRPHKLYTDLVADGEFRSSPVTHDIPNTPATSDYLRFVCISDTHNRSTFIPDGDVLLHAGDFTKTCQPREVIAFNHWMADLPHSHKLVIAGNHELFFDPSKAQTERKAVLDLLRTSGREGLELLRETERSQLPDLSRLLTSCTYLQDSGVSVAGINIWGSPWQPVHCDWAFQEERGAAMLQHWDRIPGDTDLLMTHGPPMGHGDTTILGSKHVGCVDLLSTVQKRVRPAVHVFGHVHEGYGVTSDGVTIYINASTCDRSYLPKNSPVVFDFKIPDGISKEDCHGLLSIRPWKLRS